MSDFVFADQFILEEGKTKNFYMEFLKGLVHKNNNLVGVVQGFGSLILLEDDLDPAVRENLEQMDIASRSMTELNKRILTAGGCAKIDCSPTTIQSMFGFLEDKTSEICAQNGDVNLTFEANPGLPDVVIDTTRFNEVYEELVKNAAEAAGGTDSKNVKVEFFAPGAATSTGMVDLFITNSSTDIPSSKIPDMFENFHGSKGNDHFGIGLTVAAILSGQMNARLGIRSQDEEITAWLALPTA